MGAEITEFFRRRFTQIDTEKKGRKISNFNTEYAESEENIKNKTIYESFNNTFTLLIRGHSCLFVAFKKS